MTFGCPRIDFGKVGNYACITGSLLYIDSAVTSEVSVLHLKLDVIRYARIIQRERYNSNLSQFSFITASPENQQLSVFTHYTSCVCALS